MRKCCSARKSKDFLCGWQGRESSQKEEVLSKKKFGLECFLEHQGTNFNQVVYLFGMILHDCDQEVVVVKIGVGSSTIHEEHPGWEFIHFVGHHRPFSFPCCSLKVFEKK